jgi:hypothetical protein
MTYKLHAVQFPTSKMTYNQARSAYAKDFGEIPIDHYSNRTGQFYRFTTIYTKEWLKRNGYKKYITKVLPSGTQLILVYKKDKKNNK